jgi:hypothetical protein
MAFNLMWKNELFQNRRNVRVFRVVQMWDCSQRIIVHKNVLFLNRLLFLGILLCGEGQDLFIALKLGGGSRFNKFFLLTNSCSTEILVTWECVWSSAEDYVTQCGQENDNLSQPRC